MGTNINNQALIQPNETPKSYRIRLYKNRELYGLSNTEIGKLCNEAFGVNWDESAHRKKTKNYLDGYNDAKAENATPDKQLQSMIEENKALKREAQRELMKVQTEKLEYARWQRELARDELFEEKVIQAIKDNTKVIVPKDIPVVHNGRAGQLNFADSHFGKEFKIFGLLDEVINEYSPEIYYSRMEEIYNQTIEIIEKEKLSEIHINNLGDHIEGFIRHSQLWSLRYGAIDSAIIFGNYLGDWINKLSAKTNIVYHQTDGNHDEFRLLDGKKNEHLCDTAGKIIKNCIITKNEGNPNFRYVENKTGFIFDSIAGYNVLGIHGEVPNLAQALKDFSEIYDVRIDYIIGGHKHRNDFINCGVRKGAMTVGSIVGSDDFSMRIRKSADASASFVIYEEGKGKVCEHTIILN